MCPNLYTCASARAEIRSPKWGPSTNPVVSQTMSIHSLDVRYEPRGTNVGLTHTPIVNGIQPGWGAIQHWKWHHAWTISLQVHCERRDILVFVYFYLSQSSFSRDVSFQIAVSRTNLGFSTNTRPSTYTFCLNSSDLCQFSVWSLSNCTRIQK